MQIQSLITCTVNESAQDQKLWFQVPQFLIILFFQCTPTYYMVAEVLTSCKLWFFLLKYVDLIIFIFKCILHSVIYSTLKHKPVNNNPYLSNTKLSSFLIIRLIWPLFQECSVLKKWMVMQTVYEIIHRRPHSSTTGTKVLLDYQEYLSNL